MKCKKKLEQKFQFSHFVSLMIGNLQVHSMIFQTPKSKPETNEAMNKKGLACVQATMVRIAKRNTKMPKKKLVEETIWTLAERMCPEPELITESVENLVDKGYFEYNPTTDVLHYIP